LSEHLLSVFTVLSQTLTWALKYLLQISPLDHTAWIKWRRKRNNKDPLTQGVVLGHIVTRTFFTPTMGTCNIVSGPKNYGNYTNWNKHMSIQTNKEPTTWRSAHGGLDWLILNGEETASASIGYTPTPCRRSRGHSTRECIAMRR